MGRRTMLLVLAVVAAIGGGRALAAGAGPVDLPLVERAAVATATARRDRVEVVVIGRSVQGREIFAYRLGEPGGRVVLAVGVTHGNEPKGADVTERIRTLGPPPGVELWVVDTINPDALAAGRRLNANGVDLNRNFEYNWGYIPESALNDQYSGEAPADQPETRAIQDLIVLLQPAMTVWFHQDADRVSVGGARRELAVEYARMVRQTTAATPCSAGCTGTGTQFANHAVAGGTSFLVELPGSGVVDAAMIDLHARTFLRVATL